MTKHRPAFTGQRITLFDWQLDDLTRMLGRHAEAFDLWAFLSDVDAALMKNGEVVPPMREQQAWLQQLVFAEARRRQLPVANTPKLGKLTSRMAAALDLIMRGKP